jgi:hypothetical protein
MAARGLTVEQMAARLGLSPAVVEAELRWLRLAAGKAPERETGEHYAVEVEIGAGGWLRRKERFRLLGEARLEVERGRAMGGVARVVQVADDGTREVVG